MERPSKQFSWGEENFSITYMQEKEREGKRIIPPRIFKCHETLKRLKRITQTINDYVARRWDTLQEIVLS
jgi:hypothetical protein